MISMACIFLNYLWSFPIQLVGSIIAVGVVLGVAVMGPITVLFITMPLAIFFWANIFKFQKELMGLKDNRGRECLQMTPFFLTFWLLACAVLFLS
jgi:hypothetical protein